MATKTTDIKAMKPKIAPASRDVNRPNGFTIIEVALVLAIAGLIFLVVFIAWPALQNSQKDMALRQDAGRVASALQSIMVDNNGTLLDGNGLYASGYVTSASVLSYAKNMPGVKNVTIHSAQATGGIVGWFEIPGHSTAYVSVGHRACPSSMPSPNTSYSPETVLVYNPSTNASVLVWLNSGTISCVSV